MSREADEEYLPGANEQEFNRLLFQHDVWKSVTENLFDRCHVAEVWRCLDAGAGPGFVAFDLWQRVGVEGSVAVLEPSKYYREWFDVRVKEQGWKNVRSYAGTIESAELPVETFDLIYLRWVASFLSDVEGAILRLRDCLKPGGIIAIQDYYYEGVSLYPHGAFNRIFDVMRSYYSESGGNPYVAGLLPEVFRKNGIRLIDFTPHNFAGGPTSPITEWAGRFFTSHVPILTEKGIISTAERDAVPNDWNEHRTNPDMIFFSPLVVDVAGVKPK